MSSSSEQSPSPFNLNQASDWTRRYREQHADRIKGHHFSRAALEAILAHPDCAGIRLYYGRDEQNERRLVLVGTDSEDHDLLPTATMEGTTAEPATVSFALAADDTTGATAYAQVETGTPCPPSCSTSNPLNS